MFHRELDFAVSFSVGNKMKQNCITFRDGLIVLIEASHSVRALGDVEQHSKL